MYAESGLIAPQFDNLWCSQKLNDSWGIPCRVVQTATISDYNLGGAGDLFKAAEPVIEEPTIVLDPMIAAVSMISGGDDSGIMPQPFTVSDIEPSINNGRLNEVFYECEKDLLAKEVAEGLFSDNHCIKFPTVETTHDVITDEKLLDGAPFQKCVSSSCLKSTECVEDTPTKPNFLDFPVKEFGAVCGIQRDVIEGDAMTIANGDLNLAQSPPMGIVNAYASEDREEKLSRYRSKKAKRNFGRKIKYACRKALADCQPRIRGRFAKTEDINDSIKH